MRKTIILLFAFIFSNYCNSAFSQEKKNIDSREYKILIKGEVFNNRESGVDTVWNLFRSFAESEKLKITESEDRHYEEKRQVQYLDTKNLDFLKNNFTIRKRIKYNKSKLNNQFELTIKYRVNDLFDTEKKEIIARDGLNTKSKLEEDIGALPDSTGKMKSVYSLSITAKKLSGDLGNKIEDIIDYFPSLKNIGIKSDEEIKNVNDIIIKECVYEPGEIKFGKGLKAKVEISVWYKNNETTPLVAELSFRIKFGIKVNIQAEPVITSEDFFKRLLSIMKDKMQNGFTKSNIIFGKNSE